MPNNVCYVEELVEDDGCTGCAGCANACPTGAVVMKLSPEGFYRPHVNEQSCNGCGICMKKCPVLAPSNSCTSKQHRSTPLCYAAWSTDAETHLKSSSGGVFSELSKIILEDGGTIFGCGWNSRVEPEHIEVTVLEDLAKLRGSKYVPSAVGDTLARAAASARKGRKVLFSGTPCQIAALSQLLDPVTRPNVVLVDFICHGVPSLTLFNAYKDWLFNGDPVSTFTFRDKSLCLQTVVACSQSGKIYTRRASEDPFFSLGYGAHLSTMKACFSCRFAGAPKVSDITLGDFWGVPQELDHPMGVSAVLVNSALGERLINKATTSGLIKLKASELSVIEKMNPRAIGGEWQFKPERTAFLQDVAAGQTFRWIYRNWYLPTRIKGQARELAYSGFVMVCKALKLKYLYLKMRRLTGLEKAL